MNLYWVETRDHDEDWFVVARNRRQAERFHEEAEGYDDGDARAVLVMSIPVHVIARSGWPSNAVLEQCGGTLIRLETPRVVEIAGRRYGEGMLEHEINQHMDDLFEARGDRRRNRTERRRPQ